jgi:hypothetical protein
MISFIRIQDGDEEYCLNPALIAGVWKQGPHLVVALPSDSILLRTPEAQAALLLAIGQPIFPDSSIPADGRVGVRYGTRMAVFVDEDGDVCVFSQDNDKKSFTGYASPAQARTLGLLMLREAAKAEARQ